MHEYDALLNGGNKESIYLSIYLTQDINGKVTMSQLDITNESQEVSPFPAGDHKASTDVHGSIKQDRNNINDPQKKHQLGTVILKKNLI